MRLSVSTLLASACLAHAGLDFPERTKEVHATADQRSVTVDFPFANHGRKPATIRHYDAPCTCLSAQVKGGKLDYQPGESGVVRATFDLGNFSGVVDKDIAIWLRNDPDDKPSIVLTVQVHIPELVRIEPKPLRWEVGEDPAPKAITITMDHDEPIRVLAIQGSNERFNQELQTVREGAEYKLTITPTDTADPGIGVLRIETDCSVSRHRVRQAFLLVRRSASGT